MPVDIITEPAGFIVRAVHAGDVDGITKLVNLPGFRHGAFARG